MLGKMEEGGWKWDKVEMRECKLRPEWGECDQIEVVLPITGQILVGAHLDGLGRYKAHSWTTVVEVKSMGDATFQQVKRKGWGVGGYFEKYKWQVSVQQLASGRQVIVACVNKKDGEVHYLNRETPWYTLDEIRARILTIESWVRRGELPTCDVKMYPCPFIYLGCEQGEDTTRIVVGDEVEKLARAYKAAKLEEDGAGRKVAELRAKLKNACGTGMKVGNDRVKVTWYMQRNPPRLDKGKVEELGLKVEDVTTQGSSERVRVEIIGEEKERGEGQ